VERGRSRDGIGRVEVERGRWIGDGRVEVEKGVCREMENENLGKLVEAVRQIAYGVHVYLGNGYLEKVYENCLRHRLQKAGYVVEAQKNLRVFDEDGYEIGDYFADLIVNGKLIIELKSVKALSGEHYAQILNYLKITGAPAGLLINFGSYKFETRNIIPNFHPDSHPLPLYTAKPEPTTPLPLYTAKPEPTTPLPLYTANYE